MGKLNLVTDEASILKAYRISSLDPTKWEDVDHDTSDSLAGALTSGPGATESGDYGDPLGLSDRGLDLQDLDMESKAAILISSKSFDPTAFLSAVHPNATYQDLASGTSHLRRVLDSRSEAIRILVEENFDRFVAVKASTDGLYTNMKDGLLEPSSEYGTKQLRDKLKQASLKADQVFLPTLENSSKANRVRSTLGVFERSKFFFNLPGSLIESIEMGRYEAALRDYKKGKFLVDQRQEQLLFGVGGPTPASSETTKQQHKRIVDKVWGAVEKVMSEMRALLISQLKEPTRSVEEQEKTIEILLDMNVVDDPVWVYFDSQHKHILNHMRTSHDKFLDRIAVARDSMSSSVTQQSNIVKDLQHSISMLGLQSPDTALAKGVGHEVWNAIMEMMKNLSEAILGSLPSFWKIAKAYMDGKFKKTNTTNLSASRRSPSQCRTMALDIVKLYISLLSEFFTLSDKAVVTPSGESVIVPPFVPPGSNSLTTAHYVAKILSEINECVHDIMAVELSGDATSSLKSLLESARWRFEDALCDTWLRDAGMMHNLETWERDPSRPSTTIHLSRIHQFQRYIITASYRIAGGIADLPPPYSSSPSTSKLSKPTPIGRDFTTKIQKAFIDSLYALLDGMEGLSRVGYVYVAQPLISTTLNEMSGPGAVGGANTVHALKPLDVSDVDTRMLLVISSFDYMINMLIPDMISQMEVAFGLSVGPERHTLMEVVEVLDKTLFGDFVKGKAMILGGIIRKGVLESDMDWYETPRPTEVRHYMYEALLFLVGIHSQVNVVAKDMLERTMNALVEDVTQEALACFQQVKKFGMGGMLRATLEIEFMHQTLVQYVTPAASETLTSIYTTISAAYSRRPGGQQDNLQRELDGVKKTLHESRRATAIEFLCFKPTRKEESGGNGRSSRG